MSKELEALERISNCPMWKGSYYKQFTASDVEFDKDIEIVRQSLTPPTSDDVCKALSEYYKSKIFMYDVSSKAFNIICSNGYYEVIRLHGDGQILFNQIYCLPPHLITLIGRFYEAQENGI